MSKGLEALKRLGWFQRKDGMCALQSNDYKIIEKELEEKETQDSVLKTFKEVIEFAQMLPQIEPNKDNGFDIISAVGINIQRDIENRERELLRKWVLETCFPKELKALEIIKAKGVNVGNLVDYEFNNDNSYEEYLDDYNYADNYFDLGKELLTEEEYDLLKEVFL